MNQSGTNISKQEIPENTRFSGNLEYFEVKSALAELRSATGGFEAVLPILARRKLLDSLRLLGFTPKIDP